GRRSDPAPRGGAGPGPPPRAGVNFAAGLRGSGAQYTEGPGEVGRERRVGCGNWVRSADLRVQGLSMLRRRASSLLMLWSFIYLILGRFFQFLVLLGRGHQAKEIEILALRHQVAILRRRVNLVPPGYSIAWLV